ncbi:MAG: DUF362 domain-containing protein [candidate division Zixibacteria bacterium]|nr:DUF362 domain-containing protein [candidate division Zixibacteria bacterium]
MKKATVVEIQSDNIISNGKINHDEAVKMLEMGLDVLSPTGVSYDLINRLFPQKHTIGIKVNALAGSKMSTLPELVYVLADIICKAGHDKNKIIVWDRKEAELKRAGYKINTSGNGCRCFATDTKGAGYSKKLYSHKSIGSLVSKIQTDICDSMINFPVLKDHSIAGLSGCLKNYFGVIHNPNKYHGDLCNPYQADLFSMDIVKSKQKLAIFDAVWVQYNGGPGYLSQWTVEYKAVLISTDAVALDTVAAKIIDNLRTNNGLKTLKECGREPAGVFDAGKEELGCADLDNIEWLKRKV